MVTEVSVRIKIILLLGSEVAKFVEKNFVKELKKLETFKKKDYRTCLQDVFLKLDQLMFDQGRQVIAWQDGSLRPLVI